MSKWDVQLATEIMPQLDAWMFEQLGNKVLTGPFKGMTIPHQGVWMDGNTGCKLLGSYEHELHPHIERAIERKPQVVVNLGSAEGYYAIGLAMRLPEARVIASDIDERSLALLHLYAGRNKVIIKALGEIKQPAQLDMGPDRTLYIIDIESGEMELVDLEKCPKLQTSDLIIETHEFMVPGCFEMLSERLEKTHEIIKVGAEYPKLYDFLKAQPMILQVLLATDKRPANCGWLVAWAKNLC